MVRGRSGWSIKLQRDLENVNDPIVWFHCASLGEFEQGRPLIETFSQEFPNHKILLTFYSPSGYEIRKDYPKAHAVHYLPWDSASNARRFYDLVNPVLAIIIKYEFWYHLIQEGNKRDVPVIVCSSIFNKGQIFFKPYGAFFRRVLELIHHIFVQDRDSLELLKNIGITSVTLAGDTRMDRVAAITRETVRNETVEHFIGEQKTFIVGSSWPQDIKVLVPLINSEKHLKFIIAPHEIEESQLDRLEAHIERPCIRYSRYQWSCQAEVLIVDTIGILSHLYRYGKYAYIGGAFGKGLHNILEAATFGLPLFFGNRNYTKFSEARALVKLGGAFAIGDSEELYRNYTKLEQDHIQYQKAREICLGFVKQNIGATSIIMDHISKMLHV